MLKDEVLRYLRLHTPYSPSQCTALVEAMPQDDRTVVVIAWCSATVGVSFLSKNFERIFGYERKVFIEGGVHFIPARLHPNDLPSYLEYLETLHRKAISWLEHSDAGVFEHIYRLQHGQGHWIWIRQKLTVLSVTAEGLLDQVFMTFTDVTNWKNKLEEDRLEGLSGQSKKSKLVEALVTYKKIQEEKHASGSKTLLADKYALTSREQQVLELISKGFSSKQIAQHLFISKHTVESHRKHLLSKLKASNAAEMVQKSSTVFQT